MEESGLSLDAQLNQFFQGASGDGGNYGGKFDGTLNLDGGKMGLNRGLGLEVGLEYRYGQTANNDGLGTLLPVNFAMSMPRGDGDVLAIPTFQISQQIGDTKLFFGKMRTLKLWTDPFVDGMGLTRFQNTGLVGKAVPAGVMSYSAWTFGGFHGFENGSKFVAFVQSPSNDPTEVGLDGVFDNGFSCLLEFQQPTQFFGLPGRHVVDLTYSNKDRTSLDRNDAIIPPGGGVKPGTKDETWGVYYYGHQYVNTVGDDPNRGWGLFWNFSVSDGNPNPVQTFWYAGIGGNGSISCRPRDRWGIGYFEAHLSDTLQNSLAGVVGLRGKEAGLEVYYDFALNASTSIALDFQYILPGTTQRDWTAIGGLRLGMQF